MSGLTDHAPNSYSFAELESSNGIDKVLSDWVDKMHAKFSKDGKEFILVDCKYAITDKISKVLVVYKISNERKLFG